MYLFCLFIFYIYIYTTKAHLLFTKWWLYFHRKYEPSSQRLGIVGWVCEMPVLLICACPTSFIKSNEVEPLAEYVWNKSAID